MSREIAAVHAGNIKRREGSQRSRVIPIVEMPAMPFEALHRGPGAFVIPNPWDAGSARVLAGLGWRLWRVWSTDFWQDPDHEMRRLHEALEQELTAEALRA